MKYIYFADFSATGMSHPARGAWIEIERGNQLQSGDQSHPARGAWIEIQPKVATSEVITVAPRKGCVD